MVYTPGEQADPAFLEFFAKEFQERLEGIEIPGMEGASWDRRAAYLLWLAEGNTPKEAARVHVRRRTTTIIVEDDFGGLV